MGWPDNWTRWGIDEEGNTVELSDTQRYNLIGNGVVPQVVSNIIEVMFNHRDHDRKVSYLSAEASGLPSLSFCNRSISN